MQQPVESPPVTLGAYLRAIREAKGSSLEDMARSTRVGIRHLEALEEGRLGDLPSPVFVRGFIRAYCSFLRESPETALGHYHALAGERPATEVASTGSRPRNGRPASPLLLGVALLLVLGIGLAVLKLTVRQQGESLAPIVGTEPPVVSQPAPSPAPPRVAGTPPAQPAPSSPAPAPEPLQPAGPPAPSPPVATAPASPAPPASTSQPAPPTAAASSQRLVIKAVEPTWVRVQSDGGRIAEELLPAGASREWTAERRFLLTIGNAGGVEVTLNGRSLPPLGARGTVIQRLELPQQPTSGS